MVGPLIRRPDSTRLPPRAVETHLRIRQELKDEAERAARRLADFDALLADLGISLDQVAAPGAPDQGARHKRVDKFDMTTTDAVEAHGRTDETYRRWAKKDPELGKKVGGRYWLDSKRLRELLNSDDD